MDASCVSAGRAGEEEKQRRRLERKYSAEYRSRSMRHDILVNELQDSRCEV